MRIRHWHARTKERDIHLGHLCAETGNTRSSSACETRRQSSTAAAHLQVARDDHLRDAGQGHQTGVRAQALLRRHGGPGWARGGRSATWPPRLVFRTSDDAPHALVAQHEQGQLTHDLLRHALRPPRVGHRHSGAWAAVAVASTLCLAAPHTTVCVRSRSRTARRSGDSRIDTHRAVVVSRRQHTRGPPGETGWASRQKRLPARSAVSPHASWRAAVPWQRIGRVYGTTGGERLRKHSHRFAV